MNNKIFALFILMAILFTSGGYSPKAGVAMAQWPTNQYDLNDDGVVDGLDLELYRDMFHAINFNGDIRVDILDQTMIAKEVAATQSSGIGTYLPLIIK